MHIIYPHYSISVNPFSEDFLELKCMKYAIYRPHLLNSIDLLIFVKATVEASTLQFKLTEKIKN